MIREESKGRLRRVNPRGPALRPAHKQKTGGGGAKTSGEDGGKKRLTMPEEQFPLFPLFPLFPVSFGIRENPDSTFLHKWRLHPDVSSLLDEAFLKDGRGLQEAFDVALIFLLLQPGCSREC